MKSFVKKLVFIFGVFVLLNSIACKGELTPDEPVTYTVSYQTEYGSAPEAITVTKDTVLKETQLPELSSTGYIFLGWYDEDTKAQAGEYKVQKDVTLVAHWKLDPSYLKYTVIFNSMGGSEVLSQTVTNGQKAACPDNPTKEAIVSESYSFAGWYTSTDNGVTLSANAFDFNTPITANITLYAKWAATPITYVVIFNSNGGSDVSSQTLTGGQKATKPADPTKTAIVSEGYFFAGWYTSTDDGTTLSVSVFDFDTPITADTTLYAKWTSSAFTYTVSFNAKNGSSITSQTVTGGQKVTRPDAPTKAAIVSETYSFEDWYTSTDEGNTLSAAAFNFDTPITADITLYAKWNATPITYTVSFNARNGNQDFSQTITGGQKAAKPDNPTKAATATENYTFAGWYTSTDDGATLSATAFDFNTPITSTIKLYAKWTATPNIYTVSFNTFGGDTVTSQQVQYGQKATRPADPTKTSVVSFYTFEDWYTSTDQGTTLSATAFDFNTAIDSDITLYAKWDVVKPLTLECINPGTITITNPWSTLKYSKNEEALINYSGSITVNAGDKIYLLAQSSENTSSSSSKTMVIKCSSDCYVYGNIMSLVSMDEQNKWDPYASGVSQYAFANLFYNNKYIKNSEDKELYLPATTLATYCYYYMFYGCTSLTTVPALPATNLATYCYAYMFVNCTSLTTVLDLPATNLASNCYKNMFAGCTSLTTAPALPASTLTDSCYDYMFFSCSSLITTPVLSATTLAPYCYRGMFLNCTSLTTAPALPATTLADFCYSYMFSGCKSITETPELPATTLANSCYSYMFYECASLTTASELPATTLTDSCYKAMFEFCTNLASAPDLPATILAPSCYKEMFFCCSSITKAPELPVTALTDSCYSYMFYCCESITNAPSLPATTLVSHCYEGMFAGCTGLTSAPTLPATTLADSCYWGMFTGCTSLTEAPALPVETLAYACYQAMFSGCSSLTKAPALPATTLSGNCYACMFYECTSLTEAPALPAEKIAYSCYQAMFYGCTSLTEAPVLPATKLANSCYQEMFLNCTSLTTAPSLPATTLAPSCYQDMFYGCTSLTTAPSLPATSLKRCCYQEMFLNCTSLTTAPSLPATTLNESCYQGMFAGCTSLTTAPVLPATRISGSCYFYMFEGCEKLNSIECLATTIVDNTCTEDWLYGVSSTGTFIKAPDMDAWPSGANGIPSGWDVEDKEP